MLTVVERQSIVWSHTLSSYNRNISIGSANRAFLFVWIHWRRKINYGRNCDWFQEISPWMGHRYCSDIHNPCIVPGYVSNHQIFDGQMLSHLIEVPVADRAIRLCLHWYRLLVTHHHSWHQASVLRIRVHLLVDRDEICNHSVVYFQNQEVVTHLQFSEATAPLSHYQRYGLYGIEQPA